jgi:hypothetical protein
LTAATADYVEDICHLRFLRLHERDERPSLLVTWLCAAMTSIKLVAFIGEAALTVVIVVAATLSIHQAPEIYGWRGLLALAVTMTTASIVFVLGVWSALYRLSTKAHRDHDAAAPLESHQLPLHDKVEAGL